MFTPQPLIRLNVIAPCTVSRLMLVNEVQCGLFQSLQLTLDVHVIPAARNRLAASSWVSFVGAAQAAEAPKISATAAITNADSARANIKLLHSSGFAQPPAESGATTAALP